MNTLQIDTGLQTYKLNDACEVMFNPSDATFIGKIYNLFSEMEVKEKEYREGLKSLDPEKDGEKILAFMVEKDTAMRSMIDGIFNMPICEALFADMSTFALTNDGIPIWANFMLAIIDACNDNTSEMMKRSEAKIKKYTDKYKKKYHR